MANLNPKTGATIGYQETKGTTAEPFNVPMAWQSSTLSYVPLLVDGFGNLQVSGGVTGTFNENLAQVGGVNYSLGQKTMASSMPVVIASDQSILNDHTIGFDDHYGTQQYLAPNGELVAVPLYKLVGDTFSGTSIDPNTWTEVLGTGGSITLSGGETSIATGTTANNAIELTSVHIARFSGLAPNKLRIVVQLPDAGVANNVRHWGLWTATDGVTFELNQTTFQLTTRKGGVDSVIPNGTFNGQYGTTFTPGTTSHFYEIIYQPRQVIWLADNRIIHTLNAATTPWTGTLHLPIHYGNVNSGGSTTNVTFQTRLATIARFGIPQIQVDGYFQQGATAGVLIKNSPGNVHSLALSGISNGSVVTLYDGLTAAGAVIFSTGTMGPQTIPLSIPLGGEAFNIGLFLTITGAASNAKVTFD